TPERHVVMMKKMTAPNVRGSQPPSAILRRFAPKNAVSSTRNTPATPRDSAVDQCHTLRMAAYSRHVVNNMVVATAVPYAPASLSELPNATAMATVATIIIQLTTGT